MANETFEICKVLNHNTLLCENNGTQKTYMFFGEGIGFKRKVKEMFEYDSKVQNTMLMLKEEEANQYSRLVDLVSNKHLIDVVQHVVQEANQFFDNQINGNLHLTLLDHLNFAEEREKQNIRINYPFLYELQYLYPKEYTFAKEAYRYIKDELRGRYELPESELGFLVLHIHAALTDRKVSGVLLANKVLHECTQIIEEEFSQKVNLQSMYYVRFAKHVEYAIHRSKHGIPLENVLLESVKKMCPEEYQVAEKLSQHINRVLYIHLDEHEIGYLAVHIYNLRKNVV